LLLNSSVEDDTTNEVDEQQANNAVFKKEYSLMTILLADPKMKDENETTKTAPSIASSPKYILGHN
jgi:hypothetical protein